MRPIVIMVALLFTAAMVQAADPPSVVAKPDAFKTLVNPTCSHCQDEAKRRATELKLEDRVLSWTRGYSDGGAIPFRFFLIPYRVISDSYGVFVYDSDAGYARGFAPSYEFRFHGWRNGVMVMKHKDGTLYSCLTGLAFEGPKKGERLKPVPAIVSEWGWWLEKYPNAVAYRMLDKYKPIELPPGTNADSVKSRTKVDPKAEAESEVLGVWTGKSARAFPIATLEKSGLVKEDLDGGALVVLWEPKTKTASAYRPLASQPRKFKAPEPDESGASKLDAGVPTPVGTEVVAPRKVTLALAAKDAAGRFQDAETESFWDVTGRCIAGELKGYTLEWVDSVQVKWFAWSAEYPEGSLDSETKPAPTPAETNKSVKAIAGTAEFLRLLPKPFATVKAVDPKAGTVTLLADGEKESKTWPLEPDAEVKVGGWWGRLDQFKPGDRVWVWLKLDRKRNPVSVAMLADEVTEFDMHSGLWQKPGVKPKLDPKEIEAKRSEQRAWLRKLWTEKGLPGTLTFHHVFRGNWKSRSATKPCAGGVRSSPGIRSTFKSIRPSRRS